jgi:deoxycytidylate deaminase
MSRHASLFSAARQVAQESQMSQKLGAVIVKGSRIIGRGRNQLIRCVALGPLP